MTRAPDQAFLEFVKSRAAPLLPGDAGHRAQTGIPVSFTGGVPGQAPGVTVTYQVTRVTLRMDEA